MLQSAPLNPSSGQRVWFPRALGLELIHIVRVQIEGTQLSSVCAVELRPEGKQSR